MYSELSMIIIVASSGMAGRDFEQDERRVICEDDAYDDVWRLIFGHVWFKTNVTVKQSSQQTMWYFNNTKRSCMKILRTSNHWVSRESRHRSQYQNWQQWDSNPRPKTRLQTTWFWRLRPLGHVASSTSGRLTCIATVSSKDRFQDY